MSYTKHNFRSGDILYASQLNEMDDRIAANEAVLSGKAKASDIPTKLSQLTNDVGFVTSQQSGGSSGSQSTLDGIVQITTSSESGAVNVLMANYTLSDFADHSIVYNNNIRSGQYDQQYCVTPAINIVAGKTYAIKTPYGATNKTFGGFHPVANCLICFFGADGTTGGSQGTVTWLESDAKIGTFTVPSGVSTVRFAMFRGTSTDCSAAVTALNNCIMVADPPENITNDTFDVSDTTVYEMSGVFMGSETVGIRSLTEAARSIVAPLYGKKILNLGDSIFGNDRINNISQYLAEYSGATVYNGAIGGTRMTGNSRNAGAAPAYGPFDGTAMIQALASKDWTQQDANVSSITAYAVETLALWKSLDMSKIDIITLAWGTNDWTSSISLSTISQSLSTIIDTIRTNWPHIRILVVTPIWRYFESDSMGADEKMFNSVGIRQVVSTIIETAEAKRVSVLNSYSNLPLCFENMSMYMDSDHVHLNANGNALYARILNGKLNSIY